MYVYRKGKFRPNILNHEAHDKKYTFYIFVHPVVAECPAFESADNSVNDSGVYE